MSRVRADPSAGRPADDPAAASPSSPRTPAALRFVDSHTEGEPTRVIIDGWPALRGATMRERRDDLRRHHDELRRAVVREPRGHAAMVGALLTPPVAADAAAGVIFFNNETSLGMCGHGLMGVVRTLAHLGRLDPGSATFDTPVGSVRAELAADGAITIRNVAARLHARDVRVDVPGLGAVVGDVAYGGNWFFLTHLPDVQLAIGNVGELGRLANEIRRALDAAGIRGADGAEIDHVELSGPAARADADARNFVLCSGGEYDRSPCGTGTSAVMAVRYARGELKVGQPWRQESITGGLFTGWLEEDPDGGVIPFLRGTAFVTGEGTLHLDPNDPFRFGIPSR